MHSLALQSVFSKCIFANLGLRCHAGALAFARTAHELPSSLTLASHFEVSLPVGPKPSRDPVFGLLPCVHVCLPEQITVLYSFVIKTNTHFFPSSALPCQSLTRKPSQPSWRTFSR